MFCLSDYFYFDGIGEKQKCAEDHSQNYSELLYPCEVQMVCVQFKGCLVNILTLQIGRSVAIMQDMKRH